jgi:hypothetical protein
MSLLEKFMQTLTLSEIHEVAGGGAGQAIGTTSLVSGGAALGSYFGGARLGAALRSAAGPLGAFAGAVVGAGGAYFYYSRVAN